MAAEAQFARMNGLGNMILVVDMRGRGDAVTPAAAIALNADPATRFDQIMAIHDPKAHDTDAWIDILNSDGSKAQACGNGTRCVVQALASETGRKSFTFQTIAGILNAVEEADGTISVEFAACLECGTCLAVAAPGALTWHYPEGAMGVMFREG